MRLVGARWWTGRQPGRTCMGSTGGGGPSGGGTGASGGGGGGCLFLTVS